MPGQTITLGNFGQTGYVPDTAPNLLPESGFTYARNWRFEESGYATVTQGYTDALQTREAYGETFQLGNTNAKLTFLYTWELVDTNAIVVYDANSERLLLIENGSDGGLYEHNLSVQDDLVATAQYTSGTTPGEGEFTTNGEGRLIVNFPTTVSASYQTLLSTQGVEVAWVDNGGNKPTRDLIVVSAVASAGDILTVTFETPLEPSFFIDGTDYEIRVARRLFHDSLSEFRWQGTDALGIPIFNNTLEPPWELVQGVGDIGSRTISNHFKVDTLSNWPGEAVCETLNSFGSSLMAVGYERPGGPVGFQGSPRTLAISNTFDAGTLPTWNFEDLASDASIFDLSLVTDGHLLSGYESNNRFIINSTTDVVAVIVEGQDENGRLRYNGTKLEVGGGTLTARTSIPIPNGFFCIGNGTFYIHDTTSYTEIGHGLYSRSWFDTLDVARLEEVQVVYDSRTRNIWIKTPVGDTEQQIWILDVENNYTLSVLDDHQEINFLEWSAEGTPARSESWDTITSNMWDTLEENSWNDFPVTELGEYRNRMLSCGNNKVFVHDFGQTFNGRTINAVLEKEYFKLAAQDSYSTFQIDRVIPWAQNSLDFPNTILSIRVGTAGSTGETVTYTPYRNFTIGQTSKLDFRRLGRWAAVGFRCTTPGVQLSGIEMQVNSANKR